MVKILRFVGALLLTAALLVIASKSSRGKPESVSHAESDFRFEMTTVPKFAENSKARLTVTITGPLTSKEWPVLRYARSEAHDLTDLPTYRSFPLILADSTTGAYFAELSTGARGGRIQYYIQIVDTGERVKANFMMPNGKPFTLKYIGDVPPTILISHIAFIFATVFCVAMTALHAIPVMRGIAGPKLMLQYLLAAVIMTAIGGYPFGFAMNWYAFGGIWEGVPFGTDATDNKTQLLFVYLVFATVVGLGTLTERKFGRDVFGSRAIGWFGFGSLFVMLFIYLIPHSIQFGKTLTNVACYSFIGLWALAYLIGWLTSRSSKPQYDTPRTTQRVAR